LDKLMLAGGLLAASVAGGLVATGGAQRLAAAGESRASYLSLEPARLLDTRVGGAAPLGAGTTIVVATNRAGATAVGVNIALTETVGPGFVTAWAGATPRPLASVVNSSAAGENVSNFVIVPVADDGTFRLYTNAATHLVVDLMGAFVP